MHTLLDFSRALVVACLAQLATTGWAQSLAIAERPAPRVGDVWKYRTIDVWNGSEISATQVELVEVQPERLIHRRTEAGAVTTTSTTHDLQPCRSMKESTAEVCAGAFKFPMRVGDKHQFEKLPWPNGEGYVSEACEVKAQEQVKVPAGSFDAFRIECTGTLTRVIGNPFTGRVDETFWYAPKASRVVSSTYTDYRSNGGVFNRRKTELVEYIAK